MALAQLSVRGETDRPERNVVAMTKTNTSVPAISSLPGEQETVFRPRARLLQLLGDQLIRSPRLAVFELVKNAYDADATRADITMHRLGTRSASIVVLDDGVGMSLDVVRDIWFVPGHDHKALKKERGESTGLGRSPIGEKGIGRFAAHKLGNRISLVTRAKDNPEIAVDIDWARLTAAEYLSDAKAVIRARDPEVFQGQETGTRVEISELRDQRWTRGDLRRLYRDLVSICSPFDAVGEFEVEFDVSSRSQELADIPDTSEILACAPWYFEFSVDVDVFKWYYEFRPPAKLHGRIESRNKDSGKGERLLIDKKKNNGRRSSVVVDAEMLEGIGPVAGKFYAFDRSPEILGQQSEKQLIKNYLDENGGVRIYRDGIRVYNYGVEDDDWLSLDFRRFITPVLRVSRNNVLGAVSLKLRESTNLVEKTNREGFVENDSFSRLVDIVSGAFNILETERAIDKEAIRKTSRKSKDIEFDRIRDPIKEIRRIATRKKVYADLEPSIRKLEKNYDQLRETMLQAGLSGLGLATVFHEIQHGVTSLLRQAKSGAEIRDIIVQAQELEQLLAGISGLLRKSEKNSLAMTELLAKVRQASLIRFRSHRVNLVSPLIKGEQEDFTVTINSRLFVGALTNLLDNSFYWLRARWPAKPLEGSDSPRQIYLGRSDDFEQGPGIVIADTGPGFQDDPETLKEPFFTRRPNGMGLGLYYANLVMELSGGELVFPEREDVDVPEVFDGAVIALVFSGQ